MTLLDKIKGIIVKELAVDEAQVVPDAHLIDDLDADSMNLLVIFTELEKQYNIKIDDKITVKIQTVADLVKVVENKGESL